MELASPVPPCCSSTGRPMPASVKRSVKHKSPTQATVGNEHTPDHKNALESLPERSLASDVRDDAARLPASMFAAPNQSNEKKEDVQEDEVSMCTIQDEPSHTSMQTSVRASDSKIHGEHPWELMASSAVECEQLDTCSLFSFSTCNDLAYSDTDNSSDEGLSGVDFLKHPKVLSMDGCWRACGSVDRNGCSKKKIATWLERISIYSLNVRDGNGQSMCLTIRNGRKYLAGGRLYLDISGVLHRYGKTGSHVTLRRDKEY